MRCWLGLSLLLCAGTAHSQPPVAPVAPLASHFDLARYLPHPMFMVFPQHAAGRWIWREIEAPPGPPQDPPRVRIHGKQVRVRIPIG